jgi:hypothetical protein
MIAVLPALLVAVHPAKGTDLPFAIVIYLSLIAVLVALLLKYGLYMRRTPLVRIDETSLTFFGNAQSQQRSFQLRAISSIRLFRRPDFWRSSFRLAVVVDAETVDLWIPHFSGGSVSALVQALREQFLDKFEEVVA